MINSDLKNYINSARERGLTNEQIRQSLLANGWDEVDINQVLVLRSAQNMAPGPTKSKSLRRWLILATVIHVPIIIGAVFFLFISFAFNDTGQQNVSSGPALLVLFLCLTIILMWRAYSKGREVLAATLPLVSLAFASVLIVAAYVSFTQFQINEKEALTLDEKRAAQENAPYQTEVIAAKRDLICPVYNMRSEEELS